jgi:hypothetical protein
MVRGAVQFAGSKIGNRVDMEILTITTAGTPPTHHYSSDVLELHHHRVEYSIKCYLIDHYITISKPTGVPHQDILVVPTLRHG